MKHVHLPAAAAALLLLLVSCGSSESEPPHAASADYSHTYSLRAGDAIGSSRNYEFTSTYTLIAQDPRTEYRWFFDSVAVETESGAVVRWLSPLPDAPPPGYQRPTVIMHPGEVRSEVVPIQCPREYEGTPGLYLRISDDHTTVRYPLEFLPATPASG